MFPDSQGVNLPGSLEITEDSINPDLAASWLQLNLIDSIPTPIPPDWTQKNIRGPLTDFRLGPISVGGFDNPIPYVQYLIRLCEFSRS